MGLLNKFYKNNLKRIDPIKSGGTEILLRQNYLTGLTKLNGL